MVCDATNCNEIEVSKITNSFNEFEIITKLCLGHSLKFEQTEDFNQKITYTDQSLA
jgi:hypothetical protein